MGRTTTHERLAAKLAAAQALQAEIKALQKAEARQAAAALDAKARDIGRAALAIMPTLTVAEIERLLGAQAPAATTAASLDGGAID